MKINKRKIQYASLSTVFIALFVVLVLLFNVFVGYLTNRFSLKLDLTAEGAYTLSDDTKQLLRELDEEVMIYIMQSEADIQKDASGTKTNIVENIRRYGTESGNKVKYEFIDPNQNPQFYNDYPLAKASGEGQSSAFLIVKSDRRYTPVMYNNLVSRNESGSALYYATESELSGAIMHVTSDKVSKAAFITGHNESEVPGFSTILDGNKFETTTINLRSEDIPEDVNNLVIAGPMVDFTADEVLKLDAFLTVPENNIYLFWSGDANQQLPVLERFLSDWGMAVSPAWVLDQEQAYNAPFIPVGALAENDATAKIDATQQIFLAPQAHPISILWDEKSYTRVMPLATSSNVSYARVMTATSNVTDPRQDGEAKGPFNLAAVSEKVKVNANGENEYNRVYLFGSHYMAEASITGVPISSNSALLNATVSYANSQTKTMAIQPTVVQGNDLNFYESQIATLMIILVVIVPLAFLAAGIFIFLRRRHR